MSFLFGSGITSVNLAVEEFLRFILKRKWDGKASFFAVPWWMNTVWKAFDSLLLLDFILICMFSKIKYIVGRMEQNCGFTLLDTVHTRRKRQGQSWRTYKTNRQNRRTTSGRKNTIIPIDRWRTVVQREKVPNITQRESLAESGIESRSPKSLCQLQPFVLLLKWYRHISPKDVY